MGSPLDDPALTIKDPVKAAALTAAADLLPPSRPTPATVVAAVDDVAVVDATEDSNARICTGTGTGAGTQPPDLLHVVERNCASPASSPPPPTTTVSLPALLLSPTTYFAREEAHAGASTGAATGITLMETPSFLGRGIRFGAQRVASDPCSILDALSPDVSAGIPDVEALSARMLAEERCALDLDPARLAALLESGPLPVPAPERTECATAMPARPRAGTDLLALMDAQAGGGGGGGDENARKKCVSESERGGALTDAWTRAGIWADPLGSDAAEDDLGDADAGMTADVDRNETVGEAPLWRRWRIPHALMKMLETPTTQRHSMSSAAIDAVSVFISGGVCSRLFGKNPGGANVNDNFTAGYGSGSGSRSGLSPLVATLAANAAAATNAAARIAFDEVARRSVALVTHVEFSIPDAGFAIDEVPVPLFFRPRGSHDGSSGGSASGANVYGSHVFAAGIGGHRASFSGGGNGGNSGNGGNALSGIIRRARLVPTPPLSTNARLNLEWKLPAVESLLSRPMRELMEDPVLISKP
jgi:hypothetical protein